MYNIYIFGFRDKQTRRENLSITKILFFDEKCLNPVLKNPDIQK